MTGELIVVPTPLRGREAILEWGRELVANAPWRSIRHVCGNMWFVSDGPDAAEGTTILTVFMVAGSEPATTQLTLAPDVDNPALGADPSETTTCRR